MITIPCQTLENCPTKTTSIVLSEYMMEDLRQVAQETGSNRSAIIRHSVDLFLDLYCKKFSEDIEFSETEEISHV